MRRIIQAVRAWLAPRRAAAELALQSEDYRRKLEVSEAMLGQSRAAAERLKERLWDAEHQLNLANAKIEVQRLSIDETAVVVEQYRQRFEAICRLEAMKGQPPRYDANLYS